MTSKQHLLKFLIIVMHVGVQENTHADLIQTVQGIPLKTGGYGQIHKFLSPFLWNP